MAEEEKDEVLDKKAAKAQEKAARAEAKAQKKADRKKAKELNDDLDASAASWRTVGSFSCAFNSPFPIPFTI